MTKNNNTAPAHQGSSQNVAGRFLALFVFALMVRFFFIRKGFLNYSDAWAALTLGEGGGGDSAALSLELLSRIFQLFKPYYTDLTIPVNILAVLSGAVATLFWVGAARMGRRELTLPCAMAFSYLPLPVVISTSWTAAAYVGLLLGVALFFFAGAGRKGAWWYFFFFGITLSVSLAMDLLTGILLFPFIICVLMTKKEMIRGFLVFSAPVLVLVLITRNFQNVFINPQGGYGAFLWQTTNLAVDNFSIPVLVGYICAVVYLLITKEKMIALCSLAGVVPYLLLPMDSSVRLLVPFIAVIITLNYGILRFVESSEGYSLEQYILVTAFLTFFYFVTTPVKSVMFAQFTSEKNEDRVLTGHVREVVGESRLLAGEFYECFSFYSHSRPFDIVWTARDKTDIQGFEQGILALKAGRSVAITSGAKEILQQASIYPKSYIILESKKTNIYKVTNFLSGN